MKDQRSSSQDQSAKPKPKPLGPLVWAIAWLAVAAAMAIWPHAFGSREYPCEPDEILGCFISNSWGTPLGIAISLICGLIALWYFFKLRTSHENTTTSSPRPPAP